MLNKSNYYLVAAEDNTPKVQCQWETVDNQVVLQKVEGAPITVNVRDSTGKTVAFKVTMDTQFKDIFEAYAEKELVELEAVRFIYDGARVSGNGTPQTFEMVEDCCIDVTIPQRGGGCGGGGDGGGWNFGWLWVSYTWIF